MKYHKDKRKKKGIQKFIERHNRRLMDSFSNNATNNNSLIGKEISVKIESIGSKGDGIAKYNTYTVIVPKTKVDEEVIAVVQNSRGNLLFAELKKWCIERKKLIQGLQI